MGAFTFAVVTVSLKIFNFNQSLISLLLKYLMAFCVNRYVVRVQHQDALTCNNLLL